MNEMFFSYEAEEMHAGSGAEVSAEEREAVNQWFDEVAASVPDPQ